MSKQRKHLTPEEKVSILRRHFLEKVPISTVCEEAAIQPSRRFNSNAPSKTLITPIGMSRNYLAGPHLSRSPQLRGQH